VQPSSTRPPSARQRAILGWLEAHEGPANTSIQNNSGLLRKFQVCPKDLPVRSVAG